MYLRSAHTLAQIQMYLLGAHVGRAVRICQLLLGMFAPRCHLLARWQL